MSSNKKNKFMFYPEIQDKDFNEKIYLKKEFRDTEVKEYSDKVQKDFVLDPHQVFLKNYISPDTPYNGILVFHGTGVGKTCTAISIAEGFKKTLKNLNKKILILTTLKDNFRKELYDYDKERRKKNPEDIVQCTGKAYELGDESLFLTKSQKEYAIDMLKKSYYETRGYQQFANDISKNTGNWDGDESKINDKIKKFISAKFDDRVIIIDEIQNIKTIKSDEMSKNIQPILHSIIKYGKNIKLVLMSATPMFDRPDEIIFYINLLLLNDGRKELNKYDIFNNKNGTLRLGADEKLREAFTGYVSYVRGEKPYIFPFRIYPKDAIVPRIEYSISGNKIEKDKQIKYTKLVLCPMTGVQNSTYEYYFNKKIKEGKIKKETDNKDILDDVEYIEDVDEDELFKKKDFSIYLDLAKISDIVFPESDSSIGSFGKQSIDADFDNGIGGYYKNIKTEDGKKKIKYRYQEHAIFNKDTKSEAPFADEKYLEKYSTKFAKILETIKHSKGLIFVFSRWIDQGTLPFALMLEQNGFDRECIEGEENLLEYQANKLKGGGKRKQICYWCGNDANYVEHRDEKLKTYHTFRRAKYILVFGESSDIIKIRKAEAVRKFCADNNRNGEVIKVIIGTKIISEGLDFKRLRQIHIIEPWFNLSRHEQIIGRAIRNQSHYDLPKEERNVEIYQYAAVLNGKLKDRETIDLKNYRMAEYKDIIIKDISRIMKESAVDCVLFKKANIVKSDVKEKQITSSGQVLYVPIEDKPYSPMCDYKQNCNYKCNWMPNPKINYPVNTDTYNIRFAENDIEKAKKYIKNLFRHEIVYHLSSIEEYVQNKMPNMDKLFIYAALEEIVNNKNEIVYDKFSRDGYVIYRGDYYVFQPIDLERDEIPLIYRMYPEDIKINSVNLDTIKNEYEENEQESYNKLMAPSSLNTSFEKKIYDEYQKVFNNHKDIYLKTPQNMDKYIYAVVGFIIDNMSIKDETKFISIILKKYLENQKGSGSGSDIYIKQIINYLNDSHKLINYYADYNYEKSKINDNIFVGFIVSDQYFIIENLCQDQNLKSVDYKNIEFVHCTKTILGKIKLYRDLREKDSQTTKTTKKYNKIYGILNVDKKNIKKFKILDKSDEEEILTKEKEKSKRAIITGRQCTTFQKNKLLEIRKTVGMYDFDKTLRRIDYICEDIQIYFRYKNIINTDNKIWFEVIYDNI